MTYTTVETTLRSQSGRRFKEIHYGKRSLGLVLTAKMRDFVIEKDKFRRGIIDKKPSLKPIKIRKK